MAATLLTILVWLGGAATAQSADPAPQASVAYAVGADDELTVTVFNEPQLSGTFRVGPGGAFDYPLLGEIAAAGKTVDAIAADLKARLADGYLRNPQLSVEVAQFRSQSVFVIGEVRVPGKYTLSGSMSLIEALAQAGSTTTQAGSEILILRAREAVRDAPTLPDDAEAEVQRVNLRELQTGRLSQNITLRDGDTIFVPEAAKIFVTGHVRNPGQYAFEPGMTVLQATSLAGGISERGSSRRIRIIRIIDDVRQEIDAELTDIVQPNDTISVRQRLL